MLNCIPDNESVLEFAYNIVGGEEASLSFGYGIGVSSESYASLIFGYHIAVSDLDYWEPTETPVGYMTQVIGNNYPTWHAGRRLYGGKTQRVINSLGGFQLTEVATNISKTRANLFLGTADVSEPYKIWVAPRPVARSKQVKRNLLQNGSFNVINPQRVGPWGWSEALPDASGDWTIKRNKGLFGNNSIRLSVSEGESVVLKQDNDYIYSYGSSYTATVWYAGIRPSRDGWPEERFAGPKLQLSTQYADGTYDVVSVYLKTDTDGYWTKSSVTFYPTKQTHNIEVSIIAQDEDGEDVVIDIGGIQLEEGPYSLPYTEYKFEPDYLFLVYPEEDITESTAWGNVTYTRQKKVRIRDDFDYQRLLELPPSRAELSASTDEVGVTNNVFDVYVEEDGARFSIGWRITSNYIERYNADLLMDEVFDTVSVADLYADGKRNRYYFKPSSFDITQVYEALTVANKFIYVIVKETYNGKTCRVLKVCSPYLRWDVRDHLESLADIYVDDGTGTCNSVSLVSGRTDQLLIDIDSTVYLCQLKWDSAATSRDGNVILRTDPEEARIVA